MITRKENDTEKQVGLSQIVVIISVDVSNTEHHRRHLRLHELITFPLILFSSHVGRWRVLSFLHELIHSVLIETSLYCFGFFQFFFCVR